MRENPPKVGGEGVTTVARDLQKAAVKALGWPSQDTLVLKGTRAYFRGGRGGVGATSYTLKVYQSPEMRALKPKSNWKDGRWYEYADLGKSKQEGLKEISRLGGLYG